MTSAVLIYVTAPHRDEALRLGRTLVGERLAACANVLEGMTSVFRWNDGLQEHSEAVLLIKTQRDVATAAVNRICQLHPYDVPAVLVLPVEAGHQPFLNWIAAEVRGSEDCEA